MRTKPYLLKPGEDECINLSAVTFSSSSNIPQTEVGGRVGDDQRGNSSLNMLKQFRLLATQKLN